MRARVLTALMLLGIVAVVYLFLDTLLLNLAIGLISMMALYEMLSAVDILRRRDLALLAMLQAMIIPFVRAGYIRRLAFPILLMIILGYFVLLIRNFGTIGIEHCATAFLFSTLIPLFFSCAVYIRDDHGAAKGGFYLLLALGAAWLTDTGAYFIGTFFGRHKLAPVISPKKTWEGSAGGVVVCVVLMLATARLYQLTLAHGGVPLAIDYMRLGLLTPFFSVIGMLGDLSASAVKRQYGVKDFGNIMPGHGGILDRFDSVLFTLPAVYVTARHIELIFLL